MNKPFEGFVRWFLLTKNKNKAWRIEKYLQTKHWQGENRPAAQGNHSRL